jgi:hypothetical protein
MSGLINSIAKAVSDVGDAVSSVVSSVVNTVENTVKSAIKDPIGTIAKVAAIATGNAWALPLIAGADTIAHGGNVGDALKSAATAYVAGGVAGQVASGVDSAMGTGASAEGATANAGASTLAKIAGNSAGSIVTGGNPLSALISGGVSAGVGELTNQIPGFADMPTIVQNGIKSAMTSSLSSSLLNGQTPTQANLNSALAAGNAVAKNNITVADSAAGNAVAKNNITVADSAAGNAVAKNNITVADSSGLSFAVPKLETVGPSGLNSVPGATPVISPGLTSPLNNSITESMGNVLGTPNNTLSTPNLGNNMNTAYGMGTMGPPNMGIMASPNMGTMGLPNTGSNSYGMSGLNYTSVPYGVNTANQVAQNRQMPMYAKGGTIHHFADGGSEEKTDSNTSDFLKSLKDLGDLTGPSFSSRPGLMHLGQMGTPNSTAHSNIIPSLIEVLRSRGINLAHGGQPTEHQNDSSHPNYDGSPVFRTGGREGLGGKYVEGKGDGTSDDISAMLANGEYVFSADVVSALGNGSNKAGADRLGQMVEAIRSRARSSAPNKLPPDAKSPLEYLKPSKGNKHG